ncbi:MAG: hypothetical protein NZ699_06255 [Roseiflexus sp.]|nr:hypothetical protein [Roseiflexus sp.]MCS7288717.1 hypothetical protein [Roseiflexus sp.]MDW8147261.1 hypothetical protein [Roseiflexaceae bacterium]MDW8232780.1 hypothetical protein [Roseiflexaceae bacterium]
MSSVTSDPKTNVHQALANAQRQLQESIAQRELTPTPKPNLDPVVVATPEPQEAPIGATTVRFGLYGYDPAQTRRIVCAFHNQRPDIFMQLKPFVGMWFGSAELFQEGARLRRSVQATTYRRHLRR